MQAVEGKTGRVRRTLIDFSIARSLQDDDIGNGNHGNDDDGDYGDVTMEMIEKGMKFSCNSKEQFP